MLRLNGHGPKSEYEDPIRVIQVPIREADGPVMENPVAHEDISRALHIPGLFPHGVLKGRRNGDFVFIYPPRLSLVQPVNVPSTSAAGQ